MAVLTFRGTDPEEEDELTQTNGSRPHHEEAWNDFEHTGPGTLAGRYLRRFWQPVFRSQDLDAGKAMPIRLMGEDLTLYRGESGTPHVVAFRCAHRGTQLSTGWIEGDNLRCRYHGWAYDGSGQCVEQPAEPEPFCEKIRVRSYPAEEYLGLIFVYMGDGEAPPMPRYAEVEAAGAGNLVVQLYSRGCNFFNNMDNSLDEVHTQFTHWNRRVPLMEQVFPLCSGEETEYGIRRYGERNGEVRVAHFYMPNIHHSGERSVHWRVPVDDENHLIAIATRAREGADDSRNERSSEKIAQLGTAIRAGKLTIEDLPLDGYYVPVTDDVTQIGQGVIADRSIERLGRSDNGLILLRSLWSRELRALAEGRPLTQWRHPEGELLAMTRQ